MAKSLLEILEELFFDIGKLLDRAPDARPDLARISEDSGPQIFDVLANDRDPDFGDTLHISSVSNTGIRGHASISADGKHILYDPGSAFQSLATGQTATEVIKYTVGDRFGKTSISTMTVTVVGQNDPAILSSAIKNLVEGDSASAISSSGKLTISDVDNPAKFVAQSLVAGAYGHFSIDSSGAWIYTADSAHNEFAAGTVHTDKFVVASVDGTTTSVTINIAGTNDAAVLSFDAKTLTEGNAATDISASGALTISDVDSPAQFVAQSNKAGNYGHFSIDASGTWNYVADSAHNEFVAGTIYTDSFTVSSVDGTTTSVTVQITGTNDAAILSSAVKNLTEGQTAADISATGVLSIDDIDSPTTFISQSNTAGTFGHFSIDSTGAWTYTADSAHKEFVAGQTYTDVFAVSSADGTQTSVTINIAGTDDGGSGTSGKLTYLVHIDGIAGDSTIKGYENYIAVDAYTFEEISGLAPAGGQAAGKPTFDPLTIDIAEYSPALATLLLDAVNGKHIANLDLVGLKTVDQNAVDVLHIKLDDVSVAGMASESGHDTAVAFAYGKVEEDIKTQNPDGTFNISKALVDLTTGGGSIAATDHDALASSAHGHADSAGLTYLIHINGIAGDSKIAGYEDYFAVDAYTFEEITALAAGGGAGGGVGKATLDPLTVDMKELSPALTTLFADAAQGKHIANLDLVGLKNDGQTPVDVFHIKLQNASVAGIALESGHDTAVAFAYERVEQDIKTQNPDGTFDTTKAIVNATSAEVDQNALVASAHDHPDSADLTYLIHIDGIAGDSKIDGYQDYLEVDGFTFKEISGLMTGAGGQGAAKPTLDPLTVDLHGTSPALTTLLTDATQGKHIANLDLVGLNTADQTAVDVFHIKLANVTVAGIASEAGYDTAVAFDYGKVEEDIKTQNTDGTFNTAKAQLDISAGGAAIAPLDHVKLAASAHAHADDTGLAYLLHIDGIAGDSTIKGYENYIAVDAYTFEEISGLAPVGGQAAGKPTFDPLTIDIAEYSPALATLLLDAANGKHIANLDLVGLKTVDQKAIDVLHIKLDDVSVAGMASESGHDTAVAFAYGKVEEDIKTQNPDGTFNTSKALVDLTTGGGSIAATDHDALASSAHGHADSTGLTYLIHINGIAGDSKIAGYEDYFAVDAYTFEEITALAAGGGAGGGVGKSTLDPLTVDMKELSPALTTLFADAAQGKHIANLDLVGLKNDGQTPVDVFHIKLQNASVAGIALESGHDTAVAFAYERVEQDIKTQNSDGTFDTTKAIVNATSAEVDQNALVASAHDHPDSADLTYLIHIDGIAGDSKIDGYQDYLEVDGFTFKEISGLMTGAGGQGAAKPTLDPLTVDLHGLSPALTTLLTDATQGKHIANLDLVGLKTADQSAVDVFHIKLANVTVAGIASEAGYDTAVAFDYGKVEEDIKTQNTDGTFNISKAQLDISAGGATIAAVDHDLLAMFAHAHGSLLSA